MHGSLREGSHQNVHQLDAGGCEIYSPDWIRCWVWLVQMTLIGFLLSVGQGDLSYLHSGWGEV